MICAPCSKLAVFYLNKKCFICNSQIVINLCKICEVCSSKENKCAICMKIFAKQKSIKNCDSCGKK